MHVCAAVVVGSLRAQLQSLAGARLATPALHFNADGSVDATRAIAAQWVPSMAGAAFVVGHASGYVYLYHKVGARLACCPGVQTGGVGKVQVMAMRVLRCVRITRCALVTIKVKACRPGSADRRQWATAPRMAAK